MLLKGVRQAKAGRDDPPRFEDGHALVILHSKAARFKITRVEVVLDDQVLQLGEVTQRRTSAIRKRFCLRPQ